MNTFLIQRWQPYENSREFWINDATTVSMPH